MAEFVDFSSCQLKVQQRWEQEEPSCSLVGRQLGSADTSSLVDDLHAPCLVSWRQEGCHRQQQQQQPPPAAALCLGAELVVHFLIMM